MKIHSKIKTHRRTYDKGSEIPWYSIHTFLIRQAILDITRACENEARKKHVEYGYIIMSVVFYRVSYRVEMG